MLRVPVVPVTPYGGPTAMGKAYSREARKSRVETASEIVENGAGVTLTVPIELADLLELSRERAHEVSREIGLQVMEAFIAAEVLALTGPKHGRPEDREATRWGKQSGYVTIEGKRVPVLRPRIRGVDGGERTLSTYRSFQSDGDRQREVARRLVVGVSTRKYNEAVDEFVRGYGVTKSAVSRTWIRASAKKLQELKERKLADLDIAAVMIDGLGFGDCTVVVALGIDRAGKKHTLGLWSGATENATVGTELVEDMIRRGLKTDRKILWALDGGKGVRAALERKFGKDLIVQRCQLHKQRNVLDHLPPKYHATVRSRLRAAWSMTEYAEARAALTQVAEYLDKVNEAAAASLREGFEETLTLHRLGVKGPLRTSLRSTNLIESAISITRDVTRNVKRCSKTEMAERWTATAFLEAEKRFKKVRGYALIPVLIDALKSGAGQKSEAV